MSLFQTLISMSVLCASWESLKRTASHIHSIRDVLFRVYWNLVEGEIIEAKAAIYDVIRTIDDEIDSDAL